MLAILAAVVLTAGATIEADLKGGEVHAYEVDLAAGMYFAAHFDQRGIDIRSVIVGPDGSTVFDLDTREWGDEPAVIVARTAGRYRLEARTIEPRVPRGHYVLHVDALRTATPADEEGASAMALQSRGWIALKRGGKDNVLQARELYAEARTAFQSVGNRVGEADAVTALGFIANLLDDFRSAGAFDEQDIDLRRAIGDEYGETRAMVNHARTIRTLGDAPDTIGIFEAALARHKAAGRAGNAADVLGQLSMTARWTSDYGAAIEYGYEAVALSRTIGDPAREASALTSIGPVHLELGELEQAIDAYRRARQLAPEDETLKALADSQIGLALVRQGQFDAAEQSLNAGLAVWTARGWRAYESNTLRYFGELFAARGDTARAGDAFQRAAATAHDTGYAFGEALALRQAAEAMLRGGRLDDADRALTTAAALFTDADELAQAIVQTDRAKLALARGDLPGARTSAEAAVRVVESLRGRAGSERIRSAMLASSQTAFSTLIDVLMAQHAKQPAAGFDRQAFEVAERARARSLLDLVLDDRVASGDRSPLAPLRDFHRRINAKARALDDARRSKNEALTTRLLRELDELADEYGLAEAQVRHEHPSALSESEPASLDSIQRNVLDDGTVLIEFSLGESAGYAWVITRSAVSSVRLAPRREIEEAARNAQDAIQGRRLSADALTRLHRLLLQPLGALPEGARLLIVSTGALQQVPFAALPAGPAREPLVAHHEIVHAPSASVMSAVRALTGSRRQPSRIAAVFADPVFDADDPRVQAVARSAPAATTPGLPGSGTREGLARLPFTRLEADAIAKLVPRSSLLLATGFDASVKNVSAPAIGDYRIVHFATHGVLDTRTPELSGLALSMIDRDGRRQDGFLRMHDVSGLPLNADLVVLSGCETALGRSVEGEGVIGLTRGFVAAGASRVIASLWKVDDRATAELMAQLYREMLEHGKTPAAALAAAQRRLAASTQWHDPFFWAGLVIQGEWR